MLAQRNNAGNTAMNERAVATGWRVRPGARLRAFFSNRRGVAAIEFALIAPLLLMLYFVTLEVAQGMDTNKKVSRVGSMVSDLVGQLGRTVYTQDLDAIMEIGEAVLKPYTRSRANIVITGIEVDKDSKVKVKWSRKLENGVFSRDVAKGTSTTVPDDLKIPQTFLLQVTARLDYRPIIAWTAEQKTSIGLLAAFDNIGMAEAYNLRPRMTADMECANC